MKKHRSFLIFISALYFCNTFILGATNTNFEVLDVAILEDETMNRNKREAVDDISNIDSFIATNVEILDDKPRQQVNEDVLDESSGGEVICPENTEAQSCFVEDGICYCECNPGYYLEDGCVKAKTFGGQATLTEALNDTEENRRDVEKGLFELYKDDDGFINVTVIKLTATSSMLYAGSTVASYNLLYENIVDVTTDSIEEHFKTEAKCSIEDEPITSGNVTLSKESCDTIIDNKLLCESGGLYADYCDNTTTMCEVPNSGYVNCQCRYDNYYKNSPTVCIEQICMSGSGCNSPFGWCNDDVSIHFCTCMWGFDGAVCNEPWKFTLTVVASGCGLIIISLIIVVIYSKKKKKSKASKKEEGSHSDDDDDDISVHSAANKGYQSSAFPMNRMRAQVPSYSLNDQSRKQSQRYQTSSQALPGNRNGQSNYAYDASYPSSTTTFQSPRRSRNIRNPNDYY